MLTIIFIVAISAILFSFSLTMFTLTNIKDYGVERDEK